MIRLVLTFSLVTIATAIHACNLPPTYEMENPPVSDRIAKSDHVMISRAAIIKSEGNKQGTFYLVPTKVLKGKGKKVKVIGISKAEVQNLAKRSRLEAKLYNIPDQKPGQPKLWTLGNFENKLVYVGPIPCRWHQLVHVEGNVYIVSITGSKVKTNLVQDLSNTTYESLTRYMTTKTKKSDRHYR